MIQDGDNARIETAELVAGQVVVLGDQLHIRVPGQPEAIVVQVTEQNLAQINSTGVEVSFDKPADGETVSVTATITDAAGNTSLPGQDSTTIGDTTAPLSPVVVIQDGDNARIETAELVAGQVVAVVKPSQAVVVGDQLHIRVPGQPEAIVVKVTEQNLAQINSTGVEVSFDKPADGETVSVTATITDVAGNTSLPGQDSTTIGDTTAPIVNSVNIRTLEDKGVHVVMDASDEYGSIELYVIESLPGDGTLYILSSTGDYLKVDKGMHISAKDTLIFSPNINWHGNTSFNYRAIDDSKHISELSMVNIEVSALADVPMLNLEVAKWNPENIQLNMSVWRNVAKVTYDNKTYDLTKNGGNGANKDDLVAVLDHLGKGKAAEFIMPTKLSNGLYDVYYDGIHPDGMPKSWDDASKTGLIILEEDTSFASTTDKLASAGVFKDKNSTASQIDGQIDGYTAVLVTGYVYLEANTVYKFQGKSDDSSYIKIGDAFEQFTSWKGQDVEKEFVPTDSGFYTYTFYMHNANTAGNYNFKVVEKFSGKDLAYYPDLATAQKALNDFYGMDDMSVSAQIQTSQTDNDQHFYYKVYGLREGEVGDQIYLGELNSSLLDRDGSESLTLRFSGLVKGTELHTVVGDEKILLGIADAQGVIQHNVNSLDLVEASIFAFVPQNYIVKGQSEKLNIVVEAIATESSNLHQAQDSLNFEVKLHSSTKLTTTVSAANNGDSIDIVNHAPTIQVKSEIVTVGNAKSGQAIAKYDIDDADQDALMVSLKGEDPSNLSIDTYYSLNTDDHSIVLTQVGEQFVNAGGVLPLIELEVTDHKIITPVLGTTAIVEVAANLKSTIVLTEQSTANELSQFKQPESIDIPNLGRIYKDQTGNYVVVDQLSQVKVINLADEMDKIIKNSTDYNAVTADLNFFTNYRGDDDSSEIVIINWSKIYEVLSQQSSDGRNYLDKRPKSFTSSKGTPSDWLMFDEEYSGDKYKVNSMLLNNAEMTNHIDGYNLTIHDSDHFQVNMVEGILFADSTMIANTGNTDRNGQYIVDLIQTEVKTNDQLYFVLEAKVLNGFESGVQVNGVKFKSQMLDKLNDVKIYINGSLIEKIDEYYQYSHGLSATEQEFHIVMEIKQSEILDMNAFVDSFTNDLSSNVNVLPVVSSNNNVIQPISLLEEDWMSSDDDMIYNVLNDSNLDNTLHDLMSSGVEQQLESLEVILDGPTGEVSDFLETIYSSLQESISTQKTVDQNYNVVYTNLNQQDVTDELMSNYLFY